MDRRERNEAGAGSTVNMPQESRVLALGLATLLVSLALGPRLSAQEAFAPSERVLIARNASLRAAAARDPVLTRRALTALSATTAPRVRTGAESQPELGTRDIPLGPKPLPEPGRGAPGASSGTGVGDGFDGAQDPDLNALQRASPEAAHDLFLLLKRASASTTRKPDE